MPTQAAAPNQRLPQERPFYLAMAFNWSTVLFAVLITIWNLKASCGKIVAIPVPVNCSAIEQAWVKFRQEIVLSDRGSKGARGVLDSRRKLAGQLGCDAYQLSGDFSWISRVEPGSPLSVEQYSDDGIKAMLWSALDNEAGLEKQKTSSTPLLDLVAANPDSVVLVGNSGKLELLGNGTGEWIDRHATVMRFNTNWLAELRHLIGSKRDVWVVGDYRSACGDQGPQHCTPEQLAALWERVGPDVKVYNGETPEGHGHLHDVAFTHWTSKPFLWNYFLWLKSHDHPHIKTPFPYTTPTRTGTTGLFGCLIHGIVPHMVGFDTGGCMHADYYETLRAREMFAQHKRDSPLPGRPIMHYRHEPIILSELNEAGLVHLVEPEVREDCANGIAMGIHKRADVVPALAENPLGNPGPDTPLSH